ncbi:DUF998 domain-containing protein [Luteimonas yindakuii]|uniref:DUF998 domain-containing protein n=1 Tax=Luteimonas yindakuii TaxID=2565782 RepID=UPI0010A5482E|nr:DUF998 domain-containing protein [Luteimonas yindakuii]QCO67357.1 DUF998 domain-containing protein [Luteimonas yindakuii]
MTRTRAYLLLGPVAFVWFFAWILLLDLLRPEYTSAHKAVSELGAIGAPHMWAMNLFGFIATGVMLMLAARGYRAVIPQRSRFPAAMLWLTGLLFALTAVPIAMAPDGDPDRSAPITQVHLLISQLGLLPWLIALLVLMTRFGDRAHRPLALISLLTVVAFIGVIVLYAAGVGATTPGLMQRLWFAVVLGWFGAAGLWLALAQGAGARHAVVGEGRG